MVSALTTPNIAAIVNIGAAQMKKKTITMIMMIAIMKQDMTLTLVLIPTTVKEGASLLFLLSKCKQFCPGRKLYIDLTHKTIDFFSNFCYTITCQGDGFRVETHLVELRTRRVQK